MTTQEEGTPAASWMRRLGLVAGAPLGLALSAILIWQGSHAAFTAQTSNSGNTFTAGTVILSDDDSGSAMFSVTGLEPGNTDSHCITVTYGGSLAANVKLYVAPGDLTGTNLGQYLDLVIDEGSGGSFASCAGFVASANDYTGTLKNFAAASTNSATGVSSFAPTGAAQTKVYRFTYTVEDNNAAQGLNATAKFTWEATNT